ncbi:alpha/beta hydrolase family protein [Chloroflexota bacterium]
MRNETVTLKVDGLNIIGRLCLPDGNGPFPAVCICHGISAGKYDPDDKGYPALAEKVCRQGFAVFFFNFRGTRTSEGNFDILGWVDDLYTAIDYLYALPSVDRSHISLLGFSAGAAVAIYEAAHNPKVSAVVSGASPAEFTFFTEDNLDSVIDRFRAISIIRDNGFPPSPEEWLHNFRRISPVRHVSGIAPRPLLILHGNRDDMVDISHARQLHDAAGEPRELIIIDGAGHRLRQDDKAMTIAISWLKSRNQAGPGNRPANCPLPGK